MRGNPLKFIDNIPSTPNPPHQSLLHITPEKHDAQLEYIDHGEENNKSIPVIIPEDQINDDYDVMAENDVENNNLTNDESINTPLQSTTEDVGEQSF